MSQSLSALNFEYTHKPYDSVTGLYYYGARFYDPSISRFITEDGPQYSNIQNPLTLNRYAYVLNNPETANDPNGHYDNPVVGTAGSPYSDSSWLRTSRYYYPSDNWETRDYGGPGNTYSVSGLSQSTQTQTSSCSALGPVPPNSSVCNINGGQAGAILVTIGYTTGGVVLTGVCIVIWPVCFPAGYYDAAAIGSGYYTVNNWSDATGQGANDAAVSAWPEGMIDAARFLESLPWDELF